MQLEKNGVDLSIDFMQIARLQQVEQAISNYEKRHKVPAENVGAAATLQHYCDEVGVFLDEVYGRDTYERVFGGPAGVHYGEVMDLYHDIITGLGEVRITMAERNLRMAEETADRRRRAAELKARYDAVREENNAGLEQDKAEIAAMRAEEQRQQHDTSVPYSDMSNRPRAPLAVPLAQVTPDQMVLGYPGMADPASR